jgi:hypothetical protein
MKKVIFVFLIFLYSGCTGQQGKESLRFSQEQVEQLGLGDIKLLNIIERNSIVLDFNNFLSEKEIKSSEFIDSIKFIPLETNKESLIAEINKLICTEDRFFIFDSDIGKNVLIFSKDGKFINKISKGGGPEEIFNPEDIAVDEKRKNLIVYNKTGLSFFDFNGKFIKRVRLPFYFKNFRVIPNGYLFVTVAQNWNVHLDELSNMQILISDTTFRIISAGFPFHYPKENSFGIADYTNSFDNNVNFSFKFSDKIFQFEDTLSVKKRYQLDFKKKQFPEKYTIELSYSEILKVLKQNNYYYYMGDFVECATHEYFAIYNDFNKKTYQTLIFRDKSTGEFIGGNQVLIDTGSIPLFNFPLASYKDEFIGVVSSLAINRYLSEKETHSTDDELFKNIDDDSNPILIKYKLKRFI